MIRFTKDEQVRFVSHLDVMRTMQRAVTRAKLPAKYSAGFHPHMIMAFAMALPVGASSRAEYMEIELTEAMDLEEARVALDKAMGPYFTADAVMPLPEKLPSLMAVVAASDWTLFFEADAATMQQRCDALLAQETCLVVRHGGRKEGQSVDIRPGIMSFDVEEAEEGCVLHTRLAAGSRDNVSPAMLAEALGEPEAPIRRNALYTQTESGLMPLDVLAEASA